MYQHCCYATLTSVGSLSASKTHFSQNNAVALDSTIPCLIWEHLKKIDLHCHMIGVFLFNLFSWMLEEIARRYSFQCPQQTGRVYSSLTCCKVGAYTKGYSINGKYFG